MILKYLIKCPSSVSLTVSFTVSTAVSFAISGSFHIKARSPDRFPSVSVPLNDFPVLVQIINKRYYRKDKRYPDSKHRKQPEPFKWEITYQHAYHYHLENSLNLAPLACRDHYIVIGGDERYAQLAQDLGAKKAYVV